MKINGFYIIKDEFFNFIQDPFLKDNKDGNRPFYFCIEEILDSKKMLWMIPLSSRVEKYKKIINKRLLENKPLDGLYICKLPNDRESVFLIQDIFPIKKEFIKREYTLGGNHLLLSKKSDIEIILSKAKRIIRLVTRGIRITPTSPDIIRIIKKLFY